METREMIEIIRSQVTSEWTKLVHYIFAFGASDERVAVQRARWTSLVNLADSLGIDLDN